MDKESHLESESRLAWQRRSYPIMAGIILFFSAFFIVATAYQLIRIQNKIEYEGEKDLDIFTNMEEADSPLKMEQLNLKTKAQLETYAIKRRYHQSNMLLISRIWIQYLGFLVGTILVLIGATFVLGKMREKSSSFDSDIKSLGKFAFNSSSPGLFLVFFGVVVIAITLFYHPRINVQDGSLYFDKTFKLDTGKSESEGPATMVDEEFPDLEDLDFNDENIPPPPPIE